MAAILYFEWHSLPTPAGRYSQFTCLPSRLCHSKYKMAATSDILYKSTALTKIIKFTHNHKIHTKSQNSQNRKITKFTKSHKKSQNSPKIIKIIKNHKIHQNYSIIKSIKITKWNSHLRTPSIVQKCHEMN